MAVDKFKELQASLLQKYDEGIVTEQDCIDEMLSLRYEEFAKDFFPKFYDENKKYKAESFTRAQEELSLFTQGMANYRISLTNEKGEIAEGVTIRDKVERLFRDFPNIPELQDNVVARALYEIGQTFVESPKVFNRFINDYIAVQYLNIENYRKSLEPAQVELPIPDILKRRKEPETNDKPIIRFQQLFDEFLAYKIENANLSEDLQREYRTSFPLFLHFIGDIPISRITNKEIKACLMACLKFPKRNLSQYKNKSIAELAAMEIPEDDRLSPKSIDNFRKLLQGIFAYAKEQQYIAQSPAVDLNLALRINKSKAAFNKTEVIKLLKAALALPENYEHRKWIILLGAYTGARLGELAQLRVIDLRTDADSGIRYLRITSEAGSVKTDSANRLVPIHSKLIELGLDGFIAKADGESRLFPDKYSKKVTAWFPSFMDGLGIPKLNDLNQSRTFHSFRHSFITEARGNGQPRDLIQAIVGHEKDSAGQTDVYTGQFTVDKLQPVVESILYL